MSNLGALSTSAIAGYSTLTSAWIGVLAYLGLKPDKTKAQPIADISEAARAQRLVTERYGVASGVQDSCTKQWWIVTESGMILGEGATEDEAWLGSVVMNSVEIS